MRSFFWFPVWFWVFLMMLSVILLSMLTVLLSVLSVIGQLICGKNQNWLLNLILIYLALWTGAGSGLFILMLEKLNGFYLAGVIRPVLLMRKWVGLFLRKNLLLRFFLLSLLNWICCSHIISIAKTAFKKITVVVCSMKCLSPEVTLCLYKATQWPCMEYCSVLGSVTCNR